MVILCHPLASNVVLTSTIEQTFCYWELSAWKLHEYLLDDDIHVKVRLYFFNIYLVSGLHEFALIPTSGQLSIGDFYKYSFIL